MADADQVLYYENLIKEKSTLYAAAATEYLKNPLNSTVGWAEV